MGAKNKMDSQTERQLVQLIATDRIEIPISSMSGKLKRQKPKLASAINLDQWQGNYQGGRVYGRVEVEDKLKARKISEAVDEFITKYPKYGEILSGIIEEKRSERETHLYFGVNEGCRLTSDDYMDVMRNLGFTEATANGLYSELIDVSRKISRKRKEERSVLIE